MFQVPTTREAALAMDRADPLAAARSQFSVPEGITYLVGHSLGPPPVRAQQATQEALGSWDSELVRAWNSAGWIDLADRAGAQIAGMIGAAPENVIVTDNVSVNLFKLAAAALRLTRHRCLVIEDDEFPTDRYIITELGRLQGVDVRHVPPGEGLAGLATGGVLIKSVVNYRSSEIADIPGHEAEARGRGGLIVWDLSHATGVLDLNLPAQGVRLATGCTYKYLNGGPGAPAFIYASGEIVADMRSPLPGWMGHKAPFLFASEYEPRDCAGRFASGTPPILSLACLNGALEVMSAYPMAHLQTKAVRLGAMAISRAKRLGLDGLSPEHDQRRGGHVSLRIADGYPVVQALAARGVLADFRTPDTVRMGFSPLVLSFAQVWDALDVLEDTLATGSWNKPRFHARAKVT